MLQPCVFFCLVLVFCVHVFCKSVRGLTVKLPTIFTGYSGDLCEVDRDDCAATTCPATATCVDGVNQAFCRCPVGRAAPSCTTGTDADGMPQCFLLLRPCHCVMCVHVFYHAWYEKSEKRRFKRTLFIWTIICFVIYLIKVCFVLVNSILLNRLCVDAV